MKNKELKSIPKFSNENKERAFWDSVNVEEYINMDNEINLDLSKLKPTTESISLRMPSYMLTRLKELANAQDVPYQSLMKIFLSERIDKEIAETL